MKRERKRMNQKGKDMHAHTASLIFSVDEKAVTPSQRRIGKTINFGVIYGMSAFRLARINQLKEEVIRNAGGGDR